MEQKETKNKENILALKLKKVEKALGEPVYVSLTIEKGEIKIKTILTKSAIEEAQGQEIIGDIEIFKKNKDILEKPNYWG